MHKIVPIMMLAWVVTLFGASDKKEIPFYGIPGGMPGEQPKETYWSFHPIFLFTQGGVLSEPTGPREYKQKLWSVGGGGEIRLNTEEPSGQAWCGKVTAEYWAKNYKIETSNYQLFEHGMILSPTVSYEENILEPLIFRGGAGISLFWHYQAYGLTKSEVEKLQNNIYPCPTVFLELGFIIGEGKTAWGEKKTEIRIYIGGSYLFWNSKNTRYWIDSSGNLTPMYGGDNINRHYFRGYCGIAFGK